MAFRGWAYRCTESGVSLVRTRKILALHSFCWRSVFTKGAATSSGLPPLIPMIGGIKVQDPLLIYYSTRAGEELLGTFLIRKPDKTVPGVDVPALGMVEDPGLIQALDGDEDAYPVDPHLGVYTGFFLKKDDYVWVPTVPPLFPGNNAIISLD